MTLLVDARTLPRRGRVDAPSLLIADGATDSQENEVQAAHYADESLAPSTLRSDVRRQSYNHNDRLCGHTLSSFRSAGASDFINDEERSR